MEFDLSPKSVWIASLALVISVLALAFGGIWIALLLVVSLAIVVRAFRAQPEPPPNPPPPVVPVPKPDVTPVPQQVLLGGEAVFEHSEEFAKLDPFQRHSQRKVLAQRLERKIAKADRVLTKAEETQADGSLYELDRIGLYFWEAHSGEWPTERAIHVRHEFERLEGSKEKQSLMALHYALKSFEKQLRQNHATPDADERGLLTDIQKYIKAAGGAIDTTDKVKLRIEQLLAPSKQGAPASAEKPEPKPPSPPDYEQKRLVSYDERAKQRAVTLSIESLQEFITINDNGDVVLRERYENVSSDGPNPVSMIETELATDYGYVPDIPRYSDLPEARTIKWKFVQPGATSGKAQIVFDPHVGSDPISFTRTWTQFNAVYFNQRDRADAGIPGTRESVSFPLFYKYELVYIRVKFAERFFPAQFQVEARRLGPQTDAGVDEAESAWATQAMDVFPEDRLVTVQLSRPLSAYSYSLTWDLPETDAEEQQLTAEQANAAEELSKRLASLKSSHSPYRPAAIAAMQALAARLEEEVGDDLRLQLYTYSYQAGKGGLTEVLERNGYYVSPDLITIGRTLVGRSFRRKSVMVYQSVLTHLKSDPSFEAIPSEKGLPKPCVAVAMPLLCPEPGGRRAAVIYLSTRSPNTGLAKLFESSDAQKALGLRIKKWYANELCTAVDMAGILLEVMPHTK